MTARCFTVGPLQENCWIVHADGADRALVVDPGDEAPRLIAALEELGLTAEAILLTHTHFDHVGAVAPLARHAPVAGCELVGLAPAAAFAGFPDDLAVRNRRTVEDALSS